MSRYVAGAWEYIRLVLKRREWLHVALFVSILLSIFLGYWGMDKGDLPWFAQILAFLIASLIALEILSLRVVSEMSDAITQLLKKDP